MGATSWRYYTPHHPDPERALQTLRADVFARGDYVDPTGSMAEKLRQTFQRFGEDPDSPAVQAKFDESLRLQQAIETGVVDNLPREDRAVVRRIREFTDFARSLGAQPPPARGGGKPRSIDELLEQAAECGTHSILDIEHVAKRPGLGVAAPLSPAGVKRAIGTTEPTHAQVEQAWADIAEGLGRWQARYVVVYQDGQPHEFAFIGCSGD